MATYIPQKAEDAASADGDLGVPILAVQKATPANTAGTDGDYEFLQMSAGRVWTSAKIDTALPAGTNAIGKLAANDGVDIGDVTVNNAAGASAVNIQDGGNVITVDGTVGISGTVPVSGPLTDTELRASAVPVSVASLPLPSGAATEATLSAINGKLVTAKTADYDTGAGTDTVQMMGIALPKSGGAVAGGTSTDPVRTDPTGTTTQPISAASLPLPSGAATAAAQTDKSQFTKITDGTDTLLISAAGSAQVALDAETTKVIGTIRALGNVGAIFDGVNTAATAPANGILGLGIYNSTEPSPSTGQSVGIQLDSKGRLRQVIMDAAGNTRGANVDANNNLNVGQATAANLNATVVGTAASGASASGNPVSTGALAATSLPTAVSNAQMVRPMADVFGRQVVIPQAPRDLVDDEILTITSQTTAQSFTKSAASTFYDIAALVIENKSSTGTEVIIYNNDGTTERCRIYVPATDTRGVVFQVPLKAAAVNVVWKAKTVTSVASVYITAQYVLNK